MTAHRLKPATNRIIPDIRVYMAGPIFRPGTEEREGIRHIRDVSPWRSEIFGPMPDDEYAEYTEISWKQKVGPFVYAGPTITLMHGIEMMELASSCLGEVASADAVFAYINHQETIGTLVEIGFAVAQKKPVFTWFTSPEIRDKYYFVQQASTAHIVEDDLAPAWNAFVLFCRKWWGGTV